MYNSSLPYVKVRYSTSFNYDGKSVRTYFLRHHTAKKLFAPIDGHRHEINPGGKPGSGNRQLVSSGGQLAAARNARQVKEAAGDVTKAYFHPLILCQLHTKHGRIPALACYQPGRDGIACFYSQGGRIAGHQRRFGTLQPVIRDTRQR